MRWVVLIVLAGCGRVGFDLAGAGDDQPPGDGPVTDGTPGDGPPTDGMTSSTVEDVASGFGDGSDVTIVSGPADHQANRLLIAAVHWVGVASIVISVTDDAGNLYQPLTRATHPQGGNAQLWFANNTLGNATNKIRATFNLPATKRRIIVHEYAQVAGMSGQATGTGNATMPTTSSVGTQPNSLVVLTCFTPAAQVAFTPGTFELVDNVGNDSQTADRVLAAAGSATGSGSLTLTPAANYAMAIAVFRR